MNILAIDTTSAIASVAIRSQEGQIKKKHSEQKMSHLQNLIPMIDSLLSECGLQIGDIDYIAVSEGPGSFTGIRIGAATAKMLAQVLQIDLIAVPSLTAYAYSAKDFEGVICPMLDARRSQVYAAAFSWRGDQCVEVIQGAAYELEELLALTSHYERVLHIGDGSKAYHEAITAYPQNSKIYKGCEQASSSRALFFRDEIGEQGLAAHVLEIAEKKLQDNLTVDPFAFKPVYMRQAEAVRKLEESRRLSGEDGAR